MLVLICAALVIGIGASILQYDANSYQRNYKDDAERQKDKEIIEQYLAEEYGEYAEDMEIVESDYNPDSYIIKTSLLENGSFDVSIEDGVVYDGLYDNGRYGFKYEFKEKNSLDEVLGDYLLDTYLNIDNCDMNPHLYDYDFRKFLDGDIKGFAESCEFNVYITYVFVDGVIKKKVLPRHAGTFRTTTHSIKYSTENIITQITAAVKRFLQKNVFSRGRRWIKLFFDS